jgi:hypothetical protein
MHVQRLRMAVGSTSPNTSAGVAIRLWAPIRISISVTEAAGWDEMNLTRVMYGLGDLLIQT